MNQKRPTGREKHTVSGHVNVNKRGSGLGTGPVGNNSGYSKRNVNSSPSGNRASAPVSRAGLTRGGKSKFLGIAIIIVAFLLLRKSGILGGNSYDYESTSVSTTGGADYSSYSSILSEGSQSSSLSGIMSLISSYDYSTSESEYSSYSSSSSVSFSSGSLDTSVASGSRSKYTALKGNGKDTVTIMVYMCGTDLESKNGMASADLKEMCNANISDNVNLIVYTGGCSSWQNSIISSKVNQIYQIKDSGLILLEKDMGTAAMTDPDNLTEFIKYCCENYPADRQDLIFWDHGSGSISGYGYDEKNESAGSMTLAGINKALKNAGTTFDFIGFDACLMATLENGLMLSDYADYMIASEETEPGVGWYYTNWLTKLSQNTSMPTIEIGKAIVDDFIDVCNQKCSGQKTTLSLVDLAELENTVPSKLSDFAKTTYELILNDEYKTVSDARNNTKEFAQSSKIDQIDLVDFAYKLNTDESNELAEALLGAIKYNRTASSVSNAYGLSIYFPYKRASKVDQIVNTYNSIGMDSEYSKCIQEFASLEVSGQVSEGGTNSALSSLLDTYSGSQSSSGGDFSSIFNMLSNLSGGSSSYSASGLDTSSLSFLLGRSYDPDRAAQYISDNYFNSDNLIWTMDSDGEYKIRLSEDQWSLVETLELNVFYDDGEGYIDLGFDNVFDFDEDGNLIGNYDSTWLTINGHIVSYYYLSTTKTTDDTIITGYVPCFLNDERVELILVFDNEHPYGYVSGARYVYKNGETETIAKEMCSLKTGDKLDFLCDYYSYSGEYSDTYLLGDTLTLEDTIEIANMYIDETKVNATYRFTDLYQQQYWTPVIP